MVQEYLRSAVIVIGDKSAKGEMSMKQESKRTIQSDASMAIRYNAVINNVHRAKVGGNKLTRNPRGYGIAFKWLIYTKGMTYEDFGKRYDGSTSQNINHLLNRTKNIPDDDIMKMCEVLNVDFDYFMQLCEEIEKRQGENV